MGALASTSDVFIIRGGSDKVGTRLTTRYCDEPGVRYGQMDKTFSLREGRSTWASRPRDSPPARTRERRHGGYKLPIDRKI